MELTGLGARGATCSVLIVVKRGDNYSGARRAFSTRPRTRCAICGRLVEEIDLGPYGGAKALSHWHDSRGEWLHANRDHAPRVGPSGTGVSTGT